MFRKFITFITQRKWKFTIYFQLIYVNKDMKQNLGNNLVVRIKIGTTLLKSLSLNLLNTVAILQNIKHFREGNHF